MEDQKVWICFWDFEKQKRKVKGDLNEVNREGVADGVMNSNKII